MRYYEFKIVEAFVNRKMQKGEVPFRASSFSDAHIQKIIKDLAARTKIDPNKIMEEVSDDMKIIQNIAKYSPPLGDTILKNAVENSIFNLIFSSKIKVDLDEYKFDRKIFRELINLIKFENRHWLIRGIETPSASTSALNKRMTDITPILMPSSRPEYKKFDTVKTASLSADGDFIFYVPFMEQLLYYGAVIDIQPTGAKYECNGGNIPNNYCYIEFLILHEILHFAYGDFSGIRNTNQYSHTVHNWASDLRSNYLLVKSGYTQLPIGWYSDDINFDRAATDSYRKLVAFVDAEVKKLPKVYKAWIEEKLQSDEHTPPGSPPGEPPPEEKWIPSVGEMVLHNKEGTLGVISKINDDGTYETRPLTAEEEKMAKDLGINIG